jgi:hypothetical protein
MFEYYNFIYPSFFLLLTFYNYGTSADMGVLGIGRASIATMVTLLDY